MKHRFPWLTIGFFFLLNCSLGQELQRLSLDDPTHLGLVIEADSAVKTEGQSSIKIQTKWPVTVCLGQVPDLSVEGSRLVYRAMVRSDLEGGAFLEMWARMDGKEYFSRGMNSTIDGKSDWKEIEALFFFQKGQRADRVTLNLVINGSGTVWIDDLVLSKAPLQ